MTDEFDGTDESESLIVSGSAPAGGEQAAEDILYPDDPPRDEAGEKGGEQPNEPDQQQQDEYRLTMPQGVELDREMLTEATPVFREIGLSNDQANKLAPLGLRMVERAFQRQMDEFAVVQSQWVKAAKGDSEIGGKNFGETSRLAGIALNAAGAGSKDHELRKLLNDSGLGNHPVMLRAFRRLGAAIERAHGRGPSKGSRRQEEILYPEDVPNR